VVFFYSLYWYHGGPDFGARYWFLILLPLVVLSVRGMQTMSKAFSRPGPVFDGFSPQVVAVVGLLSLISLVNFFPWRAVDKYFHYLGMRPDIREMERRGELKDKLVVIKGDEHPDYASAWIYNPLQMEKGETIYARHVDDDTYDRLKQSFPDREIVWMLGPSLSGKGFQRIPAE
jgi:hypothetical protein